MKTLQDDQEVIRRISGDLQLKAVERKPDQVKSITLLLHGLNERGLRIYRKLLKSLPSDTHIVAPNAPFPLPRLKSDRLDYGYAWYFYNQFTQNYDVDQTMAISLLKNLLVEINPHHLPVTIIGFSQGGYLAPLLAYEIKETKLVIGISCEFRINFFSDTPQFSLVAIHGDQDPVIHFEQAQNEIKLLKEKNIEVAWHLISQLKHEINQEAAQLIKTILEQHGN